MRLSDYGQIDRGNAVSFRFDGKTYGGFQGDTLASALLANDVRLVARSFKYHRPRGILSAGSEEPNAIVTVGSGVHQTPMCAQRFRKFTMGLRPIPKIVGPA